jgi:hypothetical protein
MQFFCDVMLGRLAKYLRILGFDTLYSRSASVSTLVSKAFSDNRVILTRRTELVKRSVAAPLLFIHSNEPEEQIRQVLQHLQIAPADTKPLSRCLACNSLLHNADRHQVEGRVPAYVFSTIERFSACPECRRVYWQGTHSANMLQRIANILQLPDAQPKTLT